MKKIIICILFIVTVVSCKDEQRQTSSLNDLKVQKEAIEKQVDSLNKILKDIDQNILKLDTDSRHLIVTTIFPKKEKFKHFIEMQGVVKADKNIEIRPEIGGTIINIYVKEGQRVKSGQILIQLDDSSIQDNIAKINTQLTLAKTTYERQRRLWDQKIGSEMQFLQAKTQYESLENNKSALMTQSEKMKIKAPFSGIIDEIFSKKGELASPQLPVIRLVNLDQVYVEADVTETYLPYIKAGNEVLVKFPSINTEVRSKILQVGNVINPNNRSFKIKILVKNKDRLIKPNLLADIQIVDYQKEGIVIPSKLIQKDKKGNSFVYVVKKEDGIDKAHKNIVKIANEYNHQSLIAEGLKEDDIIINKGSLIVKDGDLIEITE
jgi:RND family efflux transporter MFP subunit